MPKIQRCACILPCSLVCCEHGSLTHVILTQGRTAAHQAAISDQLAVVAFLAEARADLNKGDQQGLTPLHVCRSRAVAGSLLRHGANPWALSKERLTPAEYLTKKGFVEVAAFITESCGE